ncbi:hypothetical protein CBER1_11887 [Cercospora berteroae]|uniref:Uncharacterized protein n=1 Tax=Cercospora berteroae TaxID=357750 RepID=A0A2S6C0J7_9PEZI|nr:hypothetical protein CBER1_11887 [Cercospora berteroae]
METMTAAFSARPSVQLDSMIVYSGPPAAKNPKIRPPRPIPALQTRDDSVPLVAMKLSTSNGDNCNDLTSAIATFTSYEAACCSGPLDTSILIETDNYYSIADMAFSTARWRDLWGNVANNVCTHSAAGSAPNKPTYPPSCWTIDVPCVCASVMPSAAALAEPQQSTRDELEMCTPVRSSPSPKVLSKSTLQAVMRAHAYSADNAAPADGSIGRGRPSALVRTDYDDTLVHPAMHDLPKETPSSGENYRSTGYTIKMP